MPTQHPAAPETPAPPPLRANRTPLAYLWRWFSGKDLNGRPCCNNTWFTEATRPLTDAERYDHLARRQGTLNEIRADLADLAVERRERRDRKAANRKAT